MKRKVASMILVIGSAGIGYAVAPSPPPRCTADLTGACVTFQVSGQTAPDFPHDRRWYDAPVCPSGDLLTFKDALGEWPWRGYYCNGGAVPLCPEHGWSLKRWEVDKEVFKSRLLFTCAAKQGKPK